MDAWSWKTAVDMLAQRGIGIREQSENEIDPVDGLPDDPAGLGSGLP